MSDSTSAGNAYAEAGVSIEAADKAIELMKVWVEKAKRPEMIGGLGGFAGLFDASALTRYKRPLLATSTDGVGTKVAIAQAMDVHDTIGYDLVGMVVDALVINETSFFRDVHPFVGLKDHVLPDLIERRRRDRMLTIWCAAASSGQEPYTIAMILADQFPELAGWTVRLLATDVSSTMVARGRRGIFSGVEVARGLPPVLRQRHLAPAGEGWQVSPALRRAVQFEQHNLAGSWDVIPRCDIVFLRNVLMYFDPAVTRRVLLQARGRLAEDGYLALGGAETTVGTDTPFRRVTLGRSAWYRPS